MATDNKGRPKVSVLMPVHNGAKYLEQAVRSILNQSFTDFEFIIVDDGSSDATPVILEQFAQEDSRIIIRRNDQNIGTTRSLNRGLEAVRGEFMARFDADDVSLPSRLKRQVELLGRHPDTAVVGTAIQLIDGTGRKLGLRRGSIDNYVHFLVQLLQDRNWLFHPTVMIRTTVMKELGGYNEDIPVTQDRDLWMRLASAGHTARVIDAPLVLYRVHDEQTESVQYEDQMSYRAQIYKDMVSSYVTYYPVDTIMQFLRDQTLSDKILCREDGMISFQDAMTSMIANIVEQQTLDKHQEALLNRYMSDAARDTACLLAGHTWSGAVAVIKFSLSLAPPSRLPRRILDMLYIACGAAGLMQRIIGRGRSE